MFDYICLDLETGGFTEKENPITEIAFIVYDGKTFEEKFRFETLVKPYDDLILTEGALKATGITREMLKDGIDANELVEILKDVFKTFTYGSKRFAYKPILVGHNIAKFDYKFLKYLFERNGDDIDKYIEDYKEDTLFLARSKWLGKTKKFNLGAACKLAGIELIDAHRAMNDVEANKKLHEFLVKTLRSEKNINTQTQQEKSPRVTFEI